MRIGAYKRGTQVPYLPAGWKAEADGSIDNSGGGHKCEIVSPVLRGEEGLAQVAEVLRTLEEKGHRVNASCGVHVHVGWNRTWASDALARLVTIVAYVERGLYAITGTKNRERGRYCGGVRKYGNQKDAKPNLDRNRYHALNLTNLARGCKDTVEFRVFSGSLNATKVIGWIQVCLGLVERALTGKRMPKRGLSEEALTGQVRRRFPDRARRRQGELLRPDLSRTFVVERAVSSRGELVALLDALSRDPRVEHVEEDEVVQLDFMPDDPYFSTAGSWGQPYDDLYGLKRISAPAAWDLSRGEGITVAVVDTGIDRTHPDLAANVWSNLGETPGNGVDDDGNGYVDDTWGWDFVAARYSSPQPA